MKVYWVNQNLGSEKTHVTSDAVLPSKYSRIWISAIENYRAFCGETAQSNERDVEILGLITLIKSPR